ncbi:uncharacterized protein LOC135805782 [Sycon ciliatum]|uniref:uncharacterized protein LOC135805782 n=1 Tax=Sycon ciliatum TaxID=27933 RepID=UPI0020AE00AA|eukprot:scpid64253/ scgid10440/ Mitochondrial cardiolipin hydrolase; Phospholipase D6 homolog
MALKPTLVGACIGAAVTGGVAWLWSWVFRRTPSTDGEVEDRVLFFPAVGQAPCQSVLRATQCRRLNCTHGHSPDHPLAVLLDALRETQHTLDIAIYTFSYMFIKEEVLAAQRRGAHVRVLVDLEQVSAGGCAVAELFKAGILVRQGPEDFYLHHKFAIIDGKTLVNGSLNWSRAGVMGNHENVLISSRPHLVNAFQEEFDRMWEMFDPSKR